MTDSVPTQTVLELMASTAPNETGGAVASNRLDFQQSWAVCLLIELHKTGLDYAVIVDYHDDIVVLDGGANATTARFFQVKSTDRAKQWGIGDLIKPAGAGKRSFLAKLYYHNVRFAPVVKELAFVSNQRFSVTLRGKEKPEAVDTCVLRELCDDQVSRVTRAIRGQLQLQEDPNWDVVLRLRFHPLSMEDHEAHAKGVFQSYIESIAPNCNRSSAAGFRAILTQIRQRNNYEKLVRSADDLLRLKGFTRSDFEKAVSIVVAKSDVRAWIPISQQLIISEGMNAFVVAGWGRDWERYHIQRMDHANRSIQQLRAAVVEELKTIEQAVPRRLADVIDVLVPSIRTKLSAGQLLTQSYLSAACLYEMYERFSPSDSET